MRKLLILEINEVPYKVYQHFRQEFPDSSLAHFFDNSHHYITKTTDEGELHPWSTWPTFYRGVDNTSHHIKDIGEELSDIDKNYPPIWQILINQGVSCGIFSSLHTYPLPKNHKKYDFLIPDPFAMGAETHPRKVQPFQQFNLSMTRKSGRSVNRGIDKKSALRLLLALPGLGLRLKTASKTIAQLLSELKHPWKTSRRRSFQAILAFDIFLKLLKKKKPTLSTFFSNHVASAMHRYWAATFPDDYASNQLPAEWIERYKNEIPFCMKELDNMLKELLIFVRKNPEYRIIVGSSMGQAATKAELIQHELFLTDAEKFKATFNGVGLEPLAAMHPQYNFKVNSDRSAEFEQKLLSIKINGEPLSFRKKEGGFFSIDLGYPNVENFKIEAESKELTLQELGFQVKPIDDQSGGTAYHIPEGSLFVYDHQNLSQDDDVVEVDLREVAPSLLRNFNVAVPKYMRTGTIKEIYQ